MAQLALGVVGAAISSYFGMGPSIGFAAGTAIGGVMFPPKGQDGPRLDDLAVQVSTYGSPITRLWGTARISGNVIWASNLVEHAQEHGGKGGSSYSSYSYTCSFAVGLCEGPIMGVRRIWADGRLIFDSRPENTGAQRDFEAVTFKVYLGDETQLEDPTMQAAMPNDVPAYRGLAYVVFTDLQLERYGNRIPNLTFEVVKSGTLTLLPPVKFGDAPNGGYGGQAADLGDDGVYWVAATAGHAANVGNLFDIGTVFRADQIALLHDTGVPGLPQIQAWNPVTHELIAYFNVPSDAQIVEGYELGWTSYSIKGAGATYGNTFYVARGSPGVPRTGSHSSCDYPPGCGVINPYAHGWSWDSAGVPTAYMDGGSSGQFQNAVYWPNVPMFGEMKSNYGPQVYWLGGNGIAFGLGVGFNRDTGVQSRGTGLCCDGSGPPGIFDGMSYAVPNWAFKTTVIGPDRTITQGYNGTHYSYLHDNGTNITYRYPGSGVLMPPIVWDADRGTLFVWAGDDGNELYGWGDPVGTWIDGHFYPYRLPPDGWPHVLGAALDRNTGLMRVLTLAADHTPTLRLFSPDTLQVVETLQLEDTLDGINIAYTGKMWDYPDQQAVLFVNSTGSFWIPYAPTLASNAIRLADIVTDLSLAAGLTEDDIDVSELTDLVLGYVLARQGTTRGAIEQLMVGYSFDAVQSGEVIKFVKRGKAPVIAFAADDLAAHSAGGDMPVPLPITRADELTLPNAVSIRYTDVDADYQTGVQRVLRQTGRAAAELSFDVPIVLTGEDAKALAAVALYSAWAARMTVTWASAMPYAKVEPTDVVTLDGNVIRVTRRTMTAGILSWEGVFDSGLSLVGAAVAGHATGGAVQTIKTAPLSYLVLIDGPLLADLDNAPGAYYAVWGQTGVGTWRGAIVEASLSGGSWATIATVTPPGSTTGTTDDALAEWTGGWVFDDQHTLTVTMDSGTIESMTRAEVLGGQNRAAVGADGRWEVIHFRNATLNPDGTYTLAGLLRGRYGTEWSMSSHVAGDRFVLMPSSSLLEIDIDNADLGVGYQYRPVTLGGTRASATVQVATINGERLKPWSPVDLSATRDEGNDITLAWVRRSRLSCRFTGPAGINTPLGESSEAYEVDVFEDNTYAVVTRTIASLVTPEATYTEAQQITDFGSAQSAVYVRVYQLSAAVGRGHYLEGTA